MCHEPHTLLARVAGIANLALTRVPERFVHTLPTVVAWVHGAQIVGACNKVHVVTLLS